MAQRQKGPICKLVYREETVKRDCLGSEYRRLSSSYEREKLVQGGVYHKKVTDHLFID